MVLNQGVKLRIVSEEEEDCTGGGIVKEARNHLRISRNGAPDSMIHFIHFSDIQNFVQLLVLVKSAIRFVVNSDHRATIITAVDNTL